MVIENPADKSVPMTNEQTKSFAEAVLAESFLERENKKAPTVDETIKAGVELPFGAMIMLKRIEVLSLPIKFTVPGLMAACSLATNPGKIVCLLIDCLVNFEGKEVNARMIGDIYPFGFYSQTEFTRIVDEELKPRKKDGPRAKWAHIY
jgi:hypothetical protein